MLPNRAFLSMLRDALLVAAVAVVTFQALRRWVGDRYVVPSDSMQPVLNGDERRGDVVFVDKLASARHRRRHDLVVVEHPEKPGQQMVKRIAARGDDPDACWIDIRDGDIWLGPDAQHLLREAKDPIAARVMRVPWAVWPAAAPTSLLELGTARVEDGELVLPPLEGDAEASRGTFTPAAQHQRRHAASARVLPTGFLGTARAVDAAYLEDSGGHGRGGEDVGVWDVGMELELAGGAAELLCTIDARTEALTFHWQPESGRVELWRNGEDAAATSLAHRPEGPHRLEFGLLDDRAFFVVDGRPDASFVVARRAEWLPPQREQGIGGPRSHVHIAVLGKEALHLRRILVFHDVFAWRERIAGFPGEHGQWPRFVEPGKWFLLGDNAFDSRDSRHFDAVSCANFTGRPRFVLGPWSRIRWLAP